MKIIETVSNISHFTLTWSNRLHVKINEAERIFFVWFVMAISGVDWPDLSRYMELNGLYNFYLSSELTFDRKPESLFTLVHVATAIGRTWNIYRTKV